jgi:hypothetical protein
MDEANRARAAALHFEAKKNGLSQTQDGTWKLSLTALDLPTPVLEAHMGTRFMVALVEIGDDEQPINHEQKARVERKPFHELPRSQQAGILCGDEKFHRFIGASSPVYAAEYLYERFDIESREELDTNPKKAAEWDDLHARYRVETGQMAEAR